MKKLFTILFAVMLSCIAMAQNFTIDLTQNPVGTLPEGVTQVSYPQNGVSFNGAQHGWCWFAFQFQANGPVKITLGGCQYINNGYEGYVTDASGTKIGDIANKTAACWHQDPAANVASYEYRGAAQMLTVYCGQYCPMAQVEELAPAPSIREVKLYSTNFQDWTDAASSTTEATKDVTLQGGETLTFSWAETQIASTGTNSKFTNTEVITAGYAMAAKTATPYFMTSTIADVTKVTYVHAATGGSRGWGLQAKGDGDADWVTLQSDYCVQAGTAVTVEVNRTNCQLRWYNLNAAQNAYMTELAIYGNVEVQPRTFQAFEIDLRAAEPVLPAGVTQVGYPNHGVSYNGAQHGWCWYGIQFAVDGPVKITLGGCQYSGEGATIKNAAGEVLATVDMAAPGCYHNGGIATWTYNVEAAETLTVLCGQYCPYVKVEPCDYVPNYTVTYFDQNGTKLGDVEVSPSEPMAFAYGVSDLPTIADGFAFRGWYTNIGLKIEENQVPNGDMKLYAKVTEVEVASVGSHFEYKLNDAYFYAEDHEGFLHENGVFHDGQHGWVFGNGGKMLLPVAGKAYVQLGLCQYSDSSDIVVTTKHSTAEVARFSNKHASCGGHTFFYNGAADTLVVSYNGTSYISNVKVYNVQNEIVKTGDYYMLASGDASSLLLVLMQLQDGDKVFLPNGVYDFGELALTQISASNVSIIGESMEGTIIYNAPDAKTESIDKTATLVVTGNNVYFQDLTIQNALDYYKANNGRAVCLQDKGTHTICKNVRLLSYQDTYYTNKPGQELYWEGGEIHGTVDYICGSGSVYFNAVELFCEKRNSNGGGSDCVTASNAQTARGDKGYVFESCVLKSECPTISLSRAWNDQPQVVYLNTIFDYSAGEFSLSGNGIQRWTIQGMNNCDPYVFGEYNSVDVEGNVVSPATNVVNFVSANNPQMETILTADQAAAYAYASFFADWNPAAEAAQVALTYSVGADGSLTWSATDASAFLKETATDAEIVTSLPTAYVEGETYRAANGRGGFGPVAVEVSSTDLEEVNVAPESRIYLENGIIYIEKNGVRYNVLGARM